MSSKPETFGKTSFIRLSVIHLGMAIIVLSMMVFKFSQNKEYQYVILSFMVLQFIAAQFIAIRFVIKDNRIALATWIIIGSLALSVLVMPIIINKSLLIGLSFLATIPLFVGATDQLRRLPSALFITFVVSAIAILLDLVSTLKSFRLQIDNQYLAIYSVIGLLFYLGCLVFIFFGRRFQMNRAYHLRINLATQYALVISGISAMVITLVTSVLISQIRNVQMNQVGKNFQTVAENFAKLSGSHLEQQMQKLQLLTEQVPLLKESLIKANSQYYGDRKNARLLLEEKNRKWQGPIKDNSFIMKYLNNPINETLSHFRGHNSFHNDILFVDGFGGLVASLGQKPKRFYFYDQWWWKTCWNGGLGNIFIGDLSQDSRTKFPKLRIAVDIIDHTTNKVIGMLSSMYLLRTLIEDLQRFKPETVDQISLVNVNGEVIASTSAEISKLKVWPQLEELTTLNKQMEPGWKLGSDHKGEAALLGYSSLSTAYNVLSDPLHRLGWHIVVSGTQSAALTGVNKSTKLAMLVGLVAMALGVLGAIAAARVITRPIENLTATASVMSERNLLTATASVMNERNLESRAELAGPEELVALSEGFNRLTNQLHQVISNLKTQTVQLEKAKGEAETATRLKGEFLANMSHEIRTPLNAILGFADILESTIDDAVMKRHAHTIKTSGTDLLHLINDILDLSKIEAGRMDIQSSATDIRVLFDELKRIFSISAKEKNILLEIEIAPEVPQFLMLDKIRLKQVLFNLIGNAVKFTDHGRVICSAKVNFTNQDNCCDLLISVHDTGIGIDPKNYTNIFKTFQQHNGDNPSNSIEGTGLGLTISKSLVEMMTGTIEVEGKLGVGAILSVNLPNVMITDASISSIKSLLPETINKFHVDFKPASILIVDDLEINRNLIIEIVRNYPLEMTEAKDGREAVLQMKQKHFDLILMDIRMPEMDGYAVLRSIRGDIINRKIPVVALTASAMREDIRKIEEAGFDDYLIRPFDQFALVRVLSKFLQYHDEDENINRDEQAPLVLCNPLTTEKWICPQDAEEELSVILKEQWQNVIEKQSIPIIQNFARSVEVAGNRHHINILTQYGKELAEYADSFDIDNVEKMLDMFEKLIELRVVS